MDYINKMTFQSKTGHPQICVLSYTRLTSNALVTLTLTQWPWYTNLT